MAKARKKSKYRSTLEKRLVPPLLEIGAQYEKHALKYPKEDGRYLLDTALPNGIAIEFKGWFRPAERTKMLAVKRAHPELDIRLVFERPQNTLSKASKTTYAAWATKHGFEWADNHVPKFWLDAPLNAASKAVLDAAVRRVTG